MPSLSLNSPNKCSVSEHMLKTVERVSTHKRDVCSHQEVGFPEHDRPAQAHQDAEPWERVHSREQNGLHYFTSYLASQLSNKDNILRSQSSCLHKDPPALKCERKTNQAFEKDAHSKALGCIQWVTIVSEKHWKSEYVCLCAYSWPRLQKRQAVTLSAWYVLRYSIVVNKIRNKIKVIISPSGLGLKRLASCWPVTGEAWSTQNRCLFRGSHRVCRSHARNDRLAKEVHQMRSGYFQWLLRKRLAKGSGDASRGGMSRWTICLRVSADENVVTQDFTSESHL